MKVVKTAAPIAFIALLAACGSSKGRSPQPSGQTQSDVSFQFPPSLPSEVFAGNSVRICGARIPADSKYRCFSDLNSAVGLEGQNVDLATGISTVTQVAASNCPCFVFSNSANSADGTLASFMGTDPSGNPTTAALPPNGAIPNLCPSQDLTEGGVPADWNFQYAIFTDDACMGTMLNADSNPNNFICFDSADLQRGPPPTRRPTRTCSRARTQTT